LERSQRRDRYDRRSDGQTIFRFGNKFGHGSKLSEPGGSGNWGETLMALHIGYETVEPWPLRRLDTPDARSREAGFTPKAMLKTNKVIGVIRLDSETQLSGVPREAWDYRLGNRSALEWILDQHKEKTPKDPTIREKFNTYRLADHKEKVVDLLMRVTRVSVETVAIVEAMRELPRT
jgi:predicted helicase